MTESQPSVEVVVGRIGRAHGIRGELTVEPRTDEPDRRFVPGTVLREEGGQRRLTVDAARWHSGRLLVRFDEVPDRTTAETLRGLVLLADVPEDEPPAGEGEFWDRDLVGLTVLTADGQVGGEVRRIQHGPQDLLVVRTTAGEERLVPFVEALVPTVDLEAGTLTLADVGGLLVDEDDR
ncbi:ribosome maturation factor RimM [Granulicoccus sp. GXG6511]|uniref:ribosome maturation factor RimM n=1 Tax=Granulicoccus sp. GXG6511 TaxID=3381351 RepID=UPI003D7CFDD2